MILWYFSLMNNIIIWSCMRSQLMELKYAHLVVSKVQLWPFFVFASINDSRETVRVSKNSKWVWSGNTTITNCRQPCGTARKSRSTITRHQEDTLSKAISSLFPIKMIAILEWTESNVQQNIEQLQTPTMGVTINKKSTTTEPPP